MSRLHEPAAGMLLPTQCLRQQAGMHKRLCLSGDAVRQRISSPYFTCKMIAFRDFSSTAYGRPEGLDHALVEANEWLHRTGLKPLNIETLTKFAGGGMANLVSSDIGVRIWYVVGTDAGAVR